MKKSSVDQLWQSVWAKRHTFLWMLTGVFLTIGVHSVNESAFETDILRNIAKKIDHKTEGRPQAVQVDSAVHLIHYLLERRSEILGGGHFKSFKAVNFHSSLQSFYIGTGACGYYSMFASRVFTELGYKVKIVQQRSLGRYGAHITLAVAVDSSQRWVLVDPLFNHIFKNADGQLATLDEVSQHWERYRSQLPSHYNPNYNYTEGYRFTNWDKLGVVSRAAYRVGAVLFGDARMKQVCLRMWVIDPYKVQGVLAFLMMGLCLFGLAYDGRKW